MAPSRHACVLVLAVLVTCAQAQTVTSCLSQPSGPCTGDDFECSTLNACIQSALSCTSSPCNVTCDGQQACVDSIVTGLGDTTVNCTGTQSCSSAEIFFSNGTSTLNCIGAQSSQMNCLQATVSFSDSADLNCFGYRACMQLKANFGDGVSVLNCGNSNAFCSTYGDCPGSCLGGTFTASNSSALVATFANAAGTQQVSIICPDNGPCSVSCVDNCLCSPALSVCGGDGGALNIIVGHGPVQYYWDGTGRAPNVINYVCNATMGQWMCPTLDNMCVNPIGPIGTYSNECDSPSPATISTVWTTVGTSSLSGQVDITNDVSNTKDCMIVPSSGGPVMTGFTIVTSSASICCPHAGLFQSGAPCRRSNPACRRAPITITSTAQCTNMPCGGGAPIGASDYALRSTAASLLPEDGDGCIMIDSTCYEAGQSVTATVFQGSEYTGIAAFNSVTKRTAPIDNNSPSQSPSPLRNAFVYTAARGYQAAFTVSTATGDYGCIALGTVSGSSCEIPIGCTTTAVSDYIFDASGSDCYAQCHAG